LPFSATGLLPRCLLGALGIGLALFFFRRRWRRLLLGWFTVFGLVHTFTLGVIFLTFRTFLELFAFTAFAFAAIGFFAEARSPVSDRNTLPRAGLVAHLFAGTARAAGRGHGLERDYGLVPLAYPTGPCKDPPIGSYKISSIREAFSPGDAFGGGAA
jgi:hypothetical protein